MRLSELAKKKGVYIDADDLKKYGHLAAWITEDSRIRVIFKGVNQYFACLVMGFPDQQVDHRNNNQTDDRKENLRLATSSQQQANRSKFSSNTSGYKGVHWNKQCKKWQVKVTKDRVEYYLGLFTCKHKAAEAYNAKAIELFGEFAQLNKVIRNETV